MTAAHGYGPYSRGCRCSVCRAAKAAYTREKRAQGAAARRGAAAAGLVYIAQGITHGRAGYQWAGCRCLACCRGAKASQVRHRRAKAVAGGAR